MRSDVPGDLASLFGDCILFAALSLAFCESCVTLSSRLLPRDFVICFPRIPRGINPIPLCHQENVATSQEMTCSGGALLRYICAFTVFTAISMATSTDMVTDLADFTVEMRSADRHEHMEMVEAIHKFPHFQKTLKRHLQSSRYRLR